MAPSPTHATYPSGRTRTAVGAGTAPIAGSSHAPRSVASTDADAIRPGRDVDGAGLPEVDEHRPGLVQQREDAQRAVGGDQVEIGHPASEQRVALAEVVVDAQAGHLRAEAPARLVHRQQLADGLAQRPSSVRRRGAARPTPSSCASTRAAIGWRSAW